MILRNISESYASDHIVSPYDSLIKKIQPDIQYEAHVAPLVTIGCCLACAICEF